MKKTVTVGETQYEIRGLKWGEKKQLKAEGYDVATMDPAKDNDDMVERIIGIGCNGAIDLNAMAVSDVYKLFFEIVQLSFATEKDAKN